MATKRRASGTGVQDGPPKSQKRRRISTFVPPTDETPEQTTKEGLALLEQIKEATDKHGQPIASEFLQLPDRKVYPEYYQTIQLPISLDMIEKKLKKRGYQRLTLLESDLRRMVSNAKFYNEKGSPVFSNAERIRKVVAGTMLKVNPAYKDPNYAPFSTPVPDEGSQSPEPESAIDAEETPKSINRTPTVDREAEAEGTDRGFAGDTFEGAQERIITEMMRLKDADGEEVFQPFISKPDRTLYKEYYDIIKHPVSLKALQRQVRGTDRRKSSTKNMSPFRTWDAFEEEVSYIWHNAREFNEDGSEIVALSDSLKNYFHGRLAEARKVVSEPPSSTDTSAPRIKLKMGPSIATKTPEPHQPRLTLRLPGKAAAESATPTTQQGVTVDSEALKRQQELVRAGSNGVELSAHTSTPTRKLRDRTSSMSKPPVPTPRPQTRNISQAASTHPSATPDVKAEMPPGQSPGVAGINGTRPREYQGQPVNNVQTPVPPARPITRASAEDSTAPDAMQQSHTPSQAAVQTPSNNWPPRKPSLYIKSRSPLISGLNISTANSPDFQLDLPSTHSIPNPQSTTISVPLSYNFLALRPVVAASSLDRQTQLTVTVGNQQKITPVGAPERRLDYTVPRYELRLNSGVTKVDLEVHATSGRGLANRANGADQGGKIEYERLTVYIHVLRQ